MSITVVEPVPAVRLMSVESDTKSAIATRYGSYDKVQSEKQPR
jgi:hypothetical protein